AATSTKKGSRSSFRSSATPATSALAFDQDDVRRLQTLGALGGLELDLGTLGQGLKSAARDAREVDEEISAPVGRRDEAVALLVAEPLDGSGCHETPPSLESRTRKEGAAAQPGTRS